MLFVVAGQVGDVPRRSVDHVLEVFQVRFALVPELIDVLLELAWHVERFVVLE